MDASRIVASQNPIGVPAMKRISFFGSLLIFTLVLCQTSFAQTRPRRVGQTPPVAQESQQTPEPTSDSTASRPTRPPVLGGANRNPNEQKPTQSQQPSGPEEVSAGDVVKVDT